MKPSPEIKGIETGLVGGQHAHYGMKLSPEITGIETAAAVHAPIWSTDETEF